MMAILRDARLRRPPQDEVRGCQRHAHRARTLIRSSPRKRGPSAGFPLEPVPAQAGTGMSGVWCTRVLPLTILRFNCQTANCQTALANAPPPVFFAGAPGRPVFASLPSPAEAREWSAVRRNQRVQRLAALTCLCDRHVRHTALHRRLFCPRDRASGRGHLIQAAFAALHPRLVQPLKAAPRSWSGRRPGASRRRGCETTPAGAASGPALHDAS